MSSTTGPLPMLFLLPGVTPPLFFPLPVELKLQISFKESLPVGIHYLSNLGQLFFYVTQYHSVYFLLDHLAWSYF